MDAPVPGEILCAFGGMPDPRHHNVQHRLLDILVIALFAVLCGAEGWVEIAAWGRQRESWLKTFLDLPHGIPSHDTFGEVFSRLDPNAFEACFAAWISSLVELSRGKLVAIDGKSIRRAFAHGWDKQAMPHMVSAFVQANHMVFAQVKAEGKGQELSAISKLLGVLELRGAVVSTDALGCQKEIAATILARGGQYLLQVKDNQPTMHQKLQAIFQEARLEQCRGYCADTFRAEAEAEHGRLEQRQAWALWNAAELLGEAAQGWEGLTSLLAVQCTREVAGQKSVEMHYYISSLDARRTAKQLAEYARGHWSVETNLHWQLDVSFNEDQSRIRTGHAAENYTRLCRMTLNLLKRETSVKAGIKTKRKCCGWNDDYLLKVVST